uniref:Uncharacterized protein n=1 Tax=Anguilla anguilla TaxID=7936 RepID=A0A0E9Y1W2_ANGAN
MHTYMQIHTHPHTNTQTHLLYIHCSIWNLICSKTQK